MSDQPTPSSSAAGHSAQPPAETTAASDATGHDSATAVEAPLFNRAELEQFDQDDQTAGRAIGKMLALFFFYTVIAMSLVVWWTIRAVGD